MYTVITTFQKEFVETPYYIDTVPDLKAEFIDFLAVYSVLLHNFTVDNISNTKQVTTAVFVDEATFGEWMNFFTEAFPTFISDRDAYCAENSITVTREVKQD